MKAQFQQQWDQCRSIISDNVDKEAYDAFFAKTEAIGYQDGMLTLQLPSHYVYEYLEGQYFDLLRKTLIRIFGEGIRLNYKVNIAEDANMNVQAPPRPEVRQEPEFNSFLNPQFTFDTFCEGKSNELALSAAITVAQKPGHTAFNPYFIFGASGVGKTHLAQAIGLKILERFPEKRVLYVTSHLFQVQYTDAVRRNLVNDFINFYQSIDVLIIDDIQEFAGKTKISTQNTFFHIFNHLHQRGCQLIMTSDRPPVELEDLVPRLLTRFKWGFTGEIEHPDYELRRCILEGKCKKEGLSIEPSVIDYIARMADDNVRDLEGIINSLLAHSIVRNRPINQELAAQVMRMIIKMEKRAITIEAIINAVLADFGVDQKQLHSKSRKREIVLARQAAMYLCKKHTTQSVSRIGMVIGNRDHATVLHAIKNVDNLLATDAEFKAKFDAVEAQLAEY
jgi:chromosomal replication initiator protein